MARLPRLGGMARDTALSSVGILATGGAQFLVSVLVGNMAGPAALGVVRGSISVANTAGLLAPAAAGQSASYFAARERAAGNHGEAAATERHLVLLGLGAGLLLSPLGMLLAAQSFGVDVGSAAGVGGLVLATAAYQVARGLRFGRGRIARATALELISAVVTVGLLLLVLLVEATGLVLVPLIAGYTLYSVGPILGVLRQGAVRLTGALRREVWLRVGWGSLGTLASSGLLQLSMVIAAAVALSAQAGLYAAALSLATPVSMLTRAFSLAYFPEIARRIGRNDAASADSSTDRVTRALILVLVPVFGALVLAAEPLLALVYRQPEYTGAVTTLQVLLIAVLITLVPIAAVTSLTARGTVGIRRSAQFSVAGLIVGLVAIAALAEPMGIEGVALGYLVGATVTSGASYIYVWRKAAHPWGWSSVSMLLAVIALGTLTALGPRLSGWAEALLAAILLTAAWAAIAVAPAMLRKNVGNPA